MTSMNLEATMDSIEEIDTELETVRVRILPGGRMDRENAAKYLGRKPKTLAIWHTEGRGPRSMKNGGRRYYFKAELDAWLAG
jgi:hypothetical protein